MCLQGSRRFKDIQRIEEILYVGYTAEDGFCCRREERGHVLKDDSSQQKRARAFSLPWAEWVVEPNGIALKTSCKKGLVKWTASLLIIEDSLRKT